MNKLIAKPTNSAQTDRQVTEDSGVDSIREFLAFKLGHEEYGINILPVQDIRSFEPPTRIANVPEHVLGVLNLRGAIVPIMDLRIRFKLEPVRYDAFTVVIVLNIGQQLVGMVVDDVSDVVRFTAEQLHPVSEFPCRMGSDHLLALGCLESRTLILLDIEKLMASDDMGLIAKQIHQIERDRP